MAELPPSGSGACESRCAQRETSARQAEVSVGVLGQPSRSRAAVRAHFCVAVVASGAIQRLSGSGSDRPRRTIASDIEGLVRDLGIAALGPLLADLTYDRCSPMSRRYCIVGGGSSWTVTGRDIDPDLRAAARLPFAASTSPVIS